MKRIKTINSALKSRPDFLELLNSDQPISGLFDLKTGLSQKRIEQYRYAYQGIGKTPVYELSLPNKNVLHIKDETFNQLGNNHYSRLWVPYLFIAEALGVINPGATHLLEVSSGSAGISLSIASQLLGYQLTVIVPNRLPKGRTYPISSSGATLIKVDGYIDNCVKLLQEMMQDGEYFACNHSEEKADLAVKVSTRIMTEYLAEFGAPDVVLSGLGNGTSTLGLFDILTTKASKTEKITFFPDIKEKKRVLGLYGPDVHLRHVEPALRLANSTYDTNDFSKATALKTYYNDSYIQGLGESSLYAIALALKLSETCKNKTFMSVAYDHALRYQETVTAM